MSKFAKTCITLSAALSAGILAVSAAHAADTVTLTASLTGPAEKPNAGDPDGTGTAGLSVNLDADMICYTLTALEVGDPVAAHIHKGAADGAGPPVVVLKAPAGGRSSDCVKADDAVVKDLVANPANYYVNVHTKDFPGGSIRGQLMK